jgi:hypothetical protein
MHIRSLVVLAMQLVSFLVLFVRAALEVPELLG